jgi:hypothetical protein
MALMKKSAPKSRLDLAKLFWQNFQVMELTTRASFSQLDLCQRSADSRWLTTGQKLKACSSWL